MRLEQYDSEMLKRQIRGIAKNYLDPERHRMFFFGSRIADKGDEKSDIDVGIEGRDPVPLDVMRKIREDVDALPLLYKFDVVDFSQTSGSFREVAKQNIELIYGDL